MRIKINTSDVIHWIFNINSFRKQTGSIYRMMRITYIWNRFWRNTSRPWTYFVAEYFIGADDI
jgi:hypothetical protein